MLYVVSLRVFVALHVLKNMSVASANIVAFISYLGLTAAFAEAFTGPLKEHLFGWPDPSSSGAELDSHQAYR